MTSIKNQYLNFKHNSNTKNKPKKHRKKHILHNYSKPKNYYNRLITFFTINSIILTLSLISLENEWTYLNFLLKLIIILFLMLTLSAIIELKYSGEYMNPIETHKLETFFKKFLKKAIKNPSKYESEHFNRYDNKTKQKFEKLFNKKHSYSLSTIIKKNNLFEITFINNTKLYEFYILKFLIKNAIHKAYIKKINNKYKIIDFD